MEGLERLRALRPGRDSSEPAPEPPAEPVRGACVARFAVTPLTRPSVPRPEHVVAYNQAVVLLQGKQLERGLAVACEAFEHAPWVCHARLNWTMC